MLLAPDPPLTTIACKGALMAVEDVSTKRCSKCLLTKPLTEFYRAPRGIGGRRGDCKACLIADVTKREALDPVKRRAKNAKFRAANEVALRQYYRNWCAANPRLVRGYEAKYAAANREKRLAIRIVNHAIRDGKLTPEPCWVCGAKAEAHHPAYSEPLMVSWLCRKHHKALHAEFLRR